MRPQQGLPRPRFVVLGDDAPNHGLDEARKVGLLANVPQHDDEAPDVVDGPVLLVLALEQPHFDEERVQDNHGRVRVLVERVGNEDVGALEDGAAERLGAGIGARQDAIQARI